jgi:3-mercaptopyruvate sulfurtransferase SseA
MNQKALLASGSLLIIVVGLVLIINANDANTALPAISTKVTAPAPVGEDPYLELPRVRLADAKAAYDQKQAVFVDVRSTDSYQAGHIPDALSIPVDDLESRLKELKPTDWIITYCT